MMTAWPFSQLHHRVPWRFHSTKKQKILNQLLFPNPIFVPQSKAQHTSVLSFFSHCHSASQFSKNDGTDTPNPLTYVKLTDPIYFLWRGGDAVHDGYSTVS